MVKTKQAGRATFTKTVMKSRKINLGTIQIATEHPAFIQMADALVTLTKIIEQLLKTF